jgi:DNA-binding MarR family transcriptional regulator
VKPLDAARAVQAWYPQIYLACHRDHKRAVNTSSGISPRESTILAHLDGETPVTMTALARHLGIGTPSLSAAIKRLVRLGYVDQGSDDRDARRRPLRLSEAGIRAMADSSVLDTARVRAMLRRLNVEERARALDGLGLLARAARRLSDRERT